MHMQADLSNTMLERIWMQQSVRDGRSSVGTITSVNLGGGLSADLQRSLAFDIARQLFVYACSCQGQQAGSVQGPSVQALRRRRQAGAPGGHTRPVKSRSLHPACSCVLAPFTRRCCLVACLPCRRMVLITMAIPRCQGWFAP